MVVDALTTWVASTSYAAHSWVSPGTRFAYTNATSCTSGSGPTWSTTLAGTTTDGSCTWTTHHALVDNVANLHEGWSSGGTYTASGDGFTFLHPTNQPCIFILNSGSGPSGTGSEPSWPTSIGTTISDGGYVWKCFFSGPNSTYTPGGPFGAYDSTNPTSPSLSLAAYKEQQLPSVWGSQYPRNQLGGEKWTSAMMETVGSLTAAAGVPAWHMVAGNFGEGGQPMAVIQKGGAGNSYAASLGWVSQVKALASAQGKSFGVVAVVLTHGEADATNASYAAAIITLATNYVADIKAITGQRYTPKFIIDQQSTTPIMPASWTTSQLPISAYQQLLAHNTSGGAVTDSGPNYATPQNSGDQHKPASGYRQRGEKYAETFVTLAKGQTWNPLQPHGGGANAGAYVYNAGAKTVTITFDVMFPPLVFDTSTVGLNHQSTYTEWASCYGFEPYDSAGHVTCTSAAIVGNTVVLQLSGTIHTGLTITYASTSDASTAGAGGYGGIPGGHYGNLRDSDPFVGHVTSVAQQNWCSHFQSPPLTMLDIRESPIANDNRLARSLAA